MSEILRQLFDDIDHLKIDIPDTCPVCHRGIEPLFVKAYYIDKSISVSYRIIFLCPRRDCQEMFITSYSQERLGNLRPSLVGFAPYKVKDEEFSDVIRGISPGFVTIYSQAKQVESRKLDQICGLGYRKALEFLIKDYLVSKYPEKEQEIKENHKFSQVISKYVDDHKVKFLAERASWLGNDHAHYIKKWDNKDITDLKRLINTTLYWISAEKELEYYKSEM